MIDWRESPYKPTWTSPLLLFFFDFSTASQASGKLTISIDTVIIFVTCNNHHTKANVIRSKLHPSCRYFIHLPPHPRQFGRVVYNYVIPPTYSHPLRLGLAHTNICFNLRRPSLTKDLCVDKRTAQFFFYIIWKKRKKKSLSRHSVVLLIYTYMFSFCFIWGIFFLLRNQLPQDTGVLRNW